MATTQAVELLADSLTRSLLPSDGRAEVEAKVRRVGAALDSETQSLVIERIMSGRGRDWIAERNA